MKRVFCLNEGCIDSQAVFTGIIQNYATPRTFMWNLEMCNSLAAIEHLYVVNVILIYALLAPLSSGADDYSDISWRRN